MPIHSTQVSPAQPPDAASILAIQQNKRKLDKEAFDSLSDSLARAATLLQNQRQLDITERAQQAEIWVNTANKIFSDPKYAGDTQAAMMDYSDFFSSGFRKYLGWSDEQVKNMGEQIAKLTPSAFTLMRMAFDEDPAKALQGMRSAYKTAESIYNSTVSEGTLDFSAEGLLGAGDKEEPAPSVPATPVSTPPAPTAQTPAPTAQVSQPTAAPSITEQQRLKNSKLYQSAEEIAKALRTNDKLNQGYKADWRFDAAGAHLEITRSVSVMGGKAGERMDAPLEGTTRDKAFQSIGFSPTDIKSLEAKMTAEYKVGSAPSPITTQAAPVVSSVGAPTAPATTPISVPKPPNTTALSPTSTRDVMSIVQKLVGSVSPSARRIQADVAGLVTIAPEPGERPTYEYKRTLKKVADETTESWRQSSEDYKARALEKAASTAHAIGYGTVAKMALGSTDAGRAYLETVVNADNTLINALFNSDAATTARDRLKLDEMEFGLRLMSALTAPEPTGDEAFDRLKALAEVQRPGYETAMKAFAEWRKTNPAAKEDDFYAMNPTYSQSISAYNETQLLMAGNSSEEIARYRKEVTTDQSLKWWQLWKQLTTLTGFRAPTGVTTGQVTQLAPAQAPMLDLTTMTDAAKELSQRTGYQ